MRKGWRRVVVPVAVLATACVFVVQSGLAGAVPAGSGRTRTYFIAAEEVDWDYAPSNRNQITGQPFGDQENVFVENGPDRIGKVYTKALYREYTDGTFRSRKPQPAHLGSLGPIIRD